MQNNSPGLSCNLGHRNFSSHRTSISHVSPLEIFVPAPFFELAITSASYEVLCSYPPGMLKEKKRAVRKRAATLIVVKGRSLFEAQFFSSPLKTSLEKGFVSITTIACLRTTLLLMVQHSTVINITS